MKTVNINKAPRRTFIGFKVRLLEDLKTNGGTTFKAGTVMAITGRWRGRFSLVLRQGSYAGCISGVYPGSFAVVAAC